MAIFNTCLPRFSAKFLGGFNSFHLSLQGRVGRQAYHHNALSVRLCPARVMDLVYVQLPRAYMDIYPRSPPTREVSARRMRHQSWHRLWITMAWVRYLQEARFARRNSGGDNVGRARQVLERSSSTMLELYGTTAYFPEQVCGRQYHAWNQCCTRARSSCKHPHPLDECGCCDEIVSVATGMPAAARDRLRF